MRVSVVIPVRLRSEYVEAAVASLTAQTRPPDEIVLVDAVDGEGSAAVADGVPGAIVVRRPRPGAAAARNAGITAATGELVGFLDADDLAKPGRLHAQAGLLETDAEAAAVVGQMENFLSPDCAHLAGRVEFPQGPQSGWHVGALLARRETLERVGPFDESLLNGEAVEWLDRFRRTAGPVRALDVVVMRRRIHETNETRRARGALNAGYLATARAAIERSRGAR